MKDRAAMPPKRYHVFISHNSKDKAKIHELIKGLERDGFEVWFDIDDIVAGENWEKQVLNELKDSKVCVTFFSEEGWGPHHLAEVKMALGLSDIKIIPVFLPGTPDNTALSQKFFELSGLPNTTTYLDFRKEFNTHSALISLQKAILGEGRGLDWSVKLERDARNWEKRRQPTYSSKILREVQDWGKKNPSEVSGKGWALINASLSAQSTRLRQIIVGLLIVVMSIAFLTLYALFQRNEAISQKAIAVKQSQVALSRQLAAQALNHLNDRVDLSLLLSIESLRIADTVEARSSLLSSLNFNPRIFGYLKGHEGIIWAASFSPKNDFLISVSSDGRIVKWNVGSFQNGSLLYENQNKYFMTVAISPDGKYFTTGDRDGQIIFWDSSSGKSFGHVLTVPSQNQINTLSFSPDGKYLASGDLNGDIVLWDTSNYKMSGGPLKTYSNPENFWVTSLIFGPNGKTLASAGNDFKITIWDLNVREPTCVLKGHTGPIWDIDYSPDGNTIASGSTDRTVMLWDVKNCSPLRPPLYEHTDLVHQVAFSPDGKTLASAGNDGLVIIWDLTSFKPTVLTGHASNVIGCKFSPDGRFLATTDVTGTVIIWSMNPKLSLGEPLGKILSDDSSIVHHTASIGALAIDPQNNSIMASGDDNGKVILWNIKTNKAFREISLDSSTSIRSLDFNPTGNLLAIGGSNNLSVSLWNMNDVLQQPTYLLKSDTPLGSSVAFSPDGKTLAYVDVVNKAFVLWDIRNNSKIGILNDNYSFDNGPVGLTFSPDGKYLATIGFDDSIRLWDVSSLKQIQIDQPPTTVPLLDVRFSPDGKLLASSILGNYVTFWDTKSKQILSTNLVGQDEDFATIAFNPDGKYLASGSFNGPIKIWDINNRALIGELNGHNDWVRDLVFTPDGKYLISVGADQRIIIWNMSIQFWKDTACKIAGRNLSQLEWKQFFNDEPYHLSCPQWPSGE